MPTNYNQTAGNLLQEKSEWGNIAKIAFRIFFVYLFIQAVPLDWKFYRDLFSREAGDPNVCDDTSMTHQLSSRQPVVACGNPDLIELSRTAAMTFGFVHFLIHE